MTTLCLREHRVAKYLLLNGEEAREGAVRGEPADGEAPYYGALRVGEKVMELDYYLYETGRKQGKYANANDAYRCDGGEADDFSGAVTYGITIAKTEDEYTEDKHIEAVTGDIIKAEEILRLLADNLVTPCSLRDVLEDICAGDLIVDHLVPVPITARSA